MGKLELSILIDAPVETVFDMLSDLPRSAERMSQIESIEVLTEGAVQIGTRWKETRSVMGSSSTEEFTVTQFDPPSRFGASGESCGARYDWLFQCIPANDGTKLVLTLDTKPITFYAKLMAPLGWLMSGIMKKCLIQDLDDLKKAAEAE